MMLELFASTIIWVIFVAIFWDDLTEFGVSLIDKIASTTIRIGDAIKEIFEDDDDLPPPPAVLTSYDMNVDNEPQYVRGLGWL